MRVLASRRWLLLRELGRCGQPCAQRASTQAYSTYQHVGQLSALAEPTVRQAALRSHQACLRQHKHGFQTFASQAIAAHQRPQLQAYARDVTSNGKRQLEEWRARCVKLREKWAVELRHLASISCVARPDAVRWNQALASLSMVLGQLSFRGAAVAQSAVPEFIPQADPPFLIAVLMQVYEFLAVVCRALYLWLLFTPAVVSAPICLKSKGELRRRWLILLHRTLENAGAAFIKWGQWAATRPDLFPDDMCKTLAQLQTGAPAHSFRHTRKTIEEAFCQPLGDVFSHFDEIPVASGSIAQVHKATLRYPTNGMDDKTVVAVKVLHPGVGAVIRRDFIIMNFIAHAADYIPGVKWLRLNESVKQFAVYMLGQVNLANEAGHLRRFNHNFRHIRDVSFPRPVNALVHPAVLVETYEKGDFVTKYVENPEHPICEQLALLGVSTLLKMLLVDNFLHADLHPGNILVRTEVRRKKLRPHLVLLDVGLTAELSSKERDLLLQFFTSVASKDGRNVALTTLQFSRKQTCENPEGFISEVKSSFDEFIAAKGRIPTGECINAVLDAVRKYRVNIDGDICTVIVTTLVLEGWQRKLDPDVDAMDVLKDILRKKTVMDNMHRTVDWLVVNGI
eukprot:jgi/Chlat1/3710/Chrsp251S03863